jgi:hypothetical protein
MAKNGVAIKRTQWQVGDAEGGMKLSALMLAAWAAWLSVLDEFQRAYVIYLSSSLRQQDHPAVIQLPVAHSSQIQADKYNDKTMIIMITEPALTNHPIVLQTIHLFVNQAFIGECV